MSDAKKKSGGIVKGLELAFDMISDGGDSDVIKKLPYCDMSGGVGRTKANCVAACGSAGVSKWTMFYEK